MHREQRRIFRGLRAQNGLLQLLALCAHAEQVLPLSLLLCDGRLTHRARAPSMGLSKAGSAWLGHGSAQLRLLGRCAVLLLKTTLHTLLGFQANNFEENGSPYVQGKTSFIWKTFASISQPSLAVPDQRSFQTKFISDAAGPKSSGCNMVWPFFFFSPTQQSHSNLAQR